MAKVLKRDGREVQFDKNKIVNAVQKAFIAVDGELTEYSVAKAINIANYIEKESLKKEKDNEIFSIEDIQDLVEKGLMSTKRSDVAKAYILYRNKRTNARGNIIDTTIDEIIEDSNVDWSKENSNKNPKLGSTQRDYMAGVISTDKTLRELLPQDIVDAHKNGEIHFHDADYFIQPIYNCCLINLEDMLQNGTVISGTYIDKPHTFSTACNIATQISAQVASSQYGGQSMSLAHLSPFIRTTRQKYIKKYSYLKDKLGDEEFKKFIESSVDSDIEKGIQILQYQVVTLMTCNGQAPFITLYMNLAEVPEGPERMDLAKAIEEVLKQRILGVKNEKGVYISPAFPKLIYALDECNIHEDSKYYYLTELAAKCTAKRMVPDYMSNKLQRQLKKGDIYPVMGCRSALTPDRTTENYSHALNYDKYRFHKYYGRFNQGVVTINLPYVALESGKDFDKFWKIFEDKLELCHRALQCRHKRLLGTYPAIAPILWKYGAIARLKDDEPIDNLLYNGYSTISLGFAGLYECTKYMTGYSHTDEGHGKQFALDVMQKMNDKCNEWKEAENIDYSLYGTPLESTTYKFAKALKDKFGEIEDITDHNYITNSYHVSVRENIDAFSKLKFESEFQNLSPGGAISYVEIPNMQHNIEGVMQLIKFIYDNIMYAELNIKSDYCQKCGFDGEILIKGEPGNLYWECPNCGNTDENTLNVARRTCGYIGTNFWNQGRTEEIRDRVLHVD